MLRLVPNMGPAHRLLYLLAGLALIFAALLAPFLKGAWAWVAVLAGVAAIGEAAAGF